MTSDLMRKLEQVAHDSRARFFPESHGEIAIVSFDGGETNYYAKFERERYMVYRESRGHPTMQGDFADLDHALMLISLLADDGFDSEPQTLRDTVHMIEADPSITDGQLAAIINRHIDPRFYSLGATLNANSVWLRVDARSHDVMYRDPTGTDGVISSSSVTDDYNMRAYDVLVVCNYAWKVQYAWKRILDWGFAPDDPQLTPILRRVLVLEEPTEP